MQRRDFLAGSTAALGLAALGRRPRPRLAERPVPTPQQLAWHRNERALFLHFGVNTFTDREWGDGHEDPAIFDPSGLDAVQWARTAASAGFRTLILTAKHHDGFCLWPSRYTTHSVAHSPWRGGAGDVVREFTDACRATGLNAGLYLSPWDRHELSYGDSEAYNSYYCDQLTELLTQYGPIAEVWFDGANGEGPNGRRQVYDWPRIHGTVRKLQPSALIFSDAGPDLRWIGNENGVAGDPNWCTMDPAAVPYAGADGPGITNALQHGDPQGSVWRPGEADVSIRPGWFYHPLENHLVRSTDNLVDLYFSSAGRNAGLLLNVPPDRAGRLHDDDALRLMEFGGWLRQMYETDLAAGQGVRAETSAGGSDGRPSHLVDGDPDTFWSPDTSAGTAQLEFGAPVTFDVVSLQEAVRHGQCVAAHRVEAWDGRAWATIADGTTIGHRRLYRVSTVSTTRLRLTIKEALDTPKISALSLYRSPA